MKCVPVPVTLIEKGDEIANLGIIDGIETVGVFVVTTIRNTVWTLGTGRGTIAHRDVVWHHSDVAYTVTGD